MASVEPPVLTGFVVGLLVALEGREEQAVQSIAHQGPTSRRFAPCVIALALFGQGCAAFTSSGPVGPLRSGNPTQLAATWAYAYGPATAIVGGVSVGGNAEMQASGVGTPPLPSPAPQAVGVRQTLGGAVEASADVGTIDSGLRLRAGLDETRSSLPVDLAFEARTGNIALFPTGSYQVSLALEAYPDIAPSHSGSQRRLILSVGIAGGVFQHQLPLPYSFNPDNDIGNPTMTMLRPELRLESAVGVYLVNRSSVGLSIVVAPWFLIGSHAPTSAICPYCGPAATPTTLAVTSYSQTWGASLILTPSYGWLHGQ